MLADDVPCLFHVNPVDGRSRHSTALQIEQMLIDVYARIHAAILDSIVDIGAVAQEHTHRSDRLYCFERHLSASLARSGGAGRRQAIGLLLVVLENRLAAYGDDFDLLRSRMGSRLPSLHKIAAFFLR